MSVQVPKGYKQTELGLIPQDWHVSQLGEYCEITSSKRIFESDYVSMGIPFYRGKEITLLTSKKPLDETYFISKEKYKEITSKFGSPKRGDILVTAIGTIGNIYLIPDDSEFYFKDGNLIWLRNIKNIDNSYLSVQLKKATQIISENSIGSSQKALTIFSLRQTPIANPPTIKEQQAIAEALSDTDALIESLEQLIAKKRQIKQGAMQELLTGQRRWPGFSGEWKTINLGDVCRITTGSKDVNEGNPNGEYPFFTCARENTYSNYYSFDCEAIMVAGNGEVGNLSYYNGKFEAYQRTYVLHSFSTNVPFLWQQLKANLVESLGIGKIGSSIPYIKKSDLLNFSFNCPLDIYEQKEIANFLRDMDEEIKILESRLNKARQIKQSMMQELLTGRIRLI